MKSQNLVLPFASMLLITSAFADYSVKIPVPAEIRFSNESPTLPETPTEPIETPFDFTPFRGSGTIEIASGGWIESYSIGNSVYRGVMFRSWGDVSIWLKGDQQELLENRSGINYVVNGDSYNCEIYEAHYSDSTNETGFHCSIVGGWNGNQYSVGQQFNVSFY
ncbi:hypothetical protein ACCE15_19265 [Pseudomonas parafulva]|uniref:hypothetical protein n=1 Tax=Pseudomonas parafulva TaxID=157782 RepID=UPI00356455FF